MRAGRRTEEGRDGRVGAPGRLRARALPRVEFCDAFFFRKGLGPPQVRALLLPLVVWWWTPELIIFFHTEVVHKS